MGDPTKKITEIKSQQSRNEPYFSKLNRQKTDDRKPEDLLRSLPQLARDIRGKIALNEKMLELFPDVELCTQILTSSILASNDMVSNAIVYNAPEIKLPGSVNNSLKDCVEEHIEGNYKLSNNLTKYVKESLVTKGAYISIVIPEAAVEEVINSKYDKDGKVVSVEAFKEALSRDDNTLSLGIFRNDEKRYSSDIKSSNENYTIVSKSLTELELKTKQASNEKMTYITSDDMGIEITDNITSIIMNEVIKDMSSEVKGASLSKFQGRRAVANEHYGKLDDVFKNSDEKDKTEFIAVNSIRDLKDKSLGRPLTFNCPVEAYIPVYIANNVERHLGGFLLLDDQGNPLSIGENDLSNNDQQMYHTNRPSQESNGTNLLTKALLGMDSMGNKDYKNKDLTLAYGKVLDAMLENKLKNSMYTEVAKFNLDSAVYGVMMSRALAGRKTKLLYLPADLVQYYAFEYRDNGTGRSMLEKLQMLFSIRSLLLMSRVSGAIRNSMPVTKVTATLDDDDVNPEKTMEEIYSSSLTARQARLPIGLIDATDITSWLHQSGFVYNFKHHSLPDMTIDVTDESRSVVEPNSDLEEKITARIYMGMSLTPEIVQAGYNSDFATTVVAKNLLMAKRIAEYQKKLIPQISRHVRIYISNDITLQNKMVDIIKANMDTIKEGVNKFLEDTTIDEKDKEKYKVIFDNDEDIINYIINKYIEEITVSIPAPEMTEAAAMKTAFDQYKSTLDEYIDIIIPDEVFTVALGDKVGNSENISKLKGMLKATLLRKWMMDNNYITEIADIISNDEDGNPRLDVMADFNSMLMPLGKAIISLLKDDSDIKKDLEKLYDDAGIVPVGEGTDGYGDNNPTGGDDTGSGDMGGGDTGGSDLGAGGDDLGLDTGDVTGDGTGDTGLPQETDNGEGTEPTPIDEGEVKDEEVGSELETPALNLFADDEEDPVEPEPVVPDKTDVVEKPTSKEFIDNLKDKLGQTDKVDASEEPVKTDYAKDINKKDDEVKVDEANTDKLGEDGKPIDPEKEVQPKDDNGLDDETKPKDGEETDEDKKKKNKYLKAHEIKH